MPWEDGSYSVIKQGHRWLPEATGEARKDPAPTSFLETAWPAYTLISDFYPPGQRSSTLLLFQVTDCGYDLPSQLILP